MPPTAWSTDLEIGLVGIDRQHQKLFGMIQQLSEAIERGQGMGMMSKLLAGLVTYTQTHFRLEEQYFEEFGYPESESHRLEHREFLWRLQELGRSFGRGERGVDATTLSFLTEWLSHHIKGTDLRYVAFLKTHGVR